MYTEIDLSEFLIRARLKLGDLALEIKEKISVGDPIDELVEDASELRMFLNAVNSNYQVWGKISLYKRIEYYTERFGLVNKPHYSKEWLDKFVPPRTLIVENATTLNIPKGVGFLYVSNGYATLVKEEKITLGDI